MNALVSIGLFVVIVGLLVIGAVLMTAALASRRQKRLLGSQESIVPVNLASVNDAVLVAQLGGQITYINETAREWYEVETGDPDLWLLAKHVNPTEAFLELFAAEGQATFRIGDRQVEAASHRIAMGDMVQFIVVMREEAPLPTLGREERGDPKALQVLSEVTRTINASLELFPTLDATLDGIQHLIPYDAAQICLWDQEQEQLHVAARAGTSAYVQAIQNEALSFGLDEGYTGWVARKRQTLLVRNIHSPGHTGALIEVEPPDPAFGSYMGVPLTVRNRFTGTLELLTIEANRFDRDDLALLNLIAEQAGIAIENARQYSEQAERVAELSGLQKIAQAISVLRDPYQLFAQLGLRLAELMETDIAGVLLYDDEQARLIAQKPIHGIPDAVVDNYVIPLEVGTAARSLWEDVSFWFSNDVSKDHMVQEMGLGVLVELAGIKATAMASMTLGEDRIGVVQVANKRDGTPFSLEDIRLLQIYADQAAIVVESARLYIEEQSRVAELRGLQQITQTMSAFTNPEELYDQLTQRIAELMAVEVCGVLLYEAEEEKLIARLPFHGVSDEVVGHYNFSVARRGLAREIWREHELYVSNNVSLDEDIDALGLREVAREAGLRTLLFAPLSAGGRRFGLLQVGNKIDGSDFDEDDKRLVAIFAGQAATLIENARLYQDTDATLRKRAAELRSVSRISHELNATLELERILEVIAVEAQRAAGARWGNLVMFDWDETGRQIKPHMQFGTAMDDEARILEVAAARSRDTLVIEDFEKVANYPCPLPEARSALIVPILFEGRSVGTISLYSDKPGGLGPDAAEYVQALSSQATIAVTNATRHAEQVERSDLLSRRAEQLTRIFELGRVFRTDQSVEDHLASVARAIRESVGFDTVLVSVLDEEHKALRHIAHAGLKAATFQQMSENPVERELVERYLSDEYRISGSYLVPGNDSRRLIEALKLPPDVEVKGGEPGTWRQGDLLLVPLSSSGGEVMGVLSVNRPRDGLRPSRDAIELLEIFGNQAAIVIENSRLYQSMEDRAEELSRSLADLEKSYGELDKLSQEMIRKDLELSQANELLNLRAQRLLALHRVMESVDSSRGPETVLRDIAASVVEEMDVDQCLILSNSRPEGSSNGHDSGMLRLIAAEGRLPKNLNSLKLLNGDDPVSSAYRSDEVIIYAPGRKSKNEDTQLAEAIGASTLMAIPMHMDAAERGVLVVGSARRGAAFTEDDGDLFNLLASQIVVEYENARLYQAVQSEAATAAAERDRLQQLHLITTALQQTTELEARLAVIARGIRSVGWGRVAVALLDGEMNAISFITAGYDEKEELKLRKLWLPGQVWRQRFEDQAFIALRLGSSYFLAYDNPWVQEHVEGISKPKEGEDPHAWHPDDQIYLPMYAGNEIIGMINLRDPVTGRRPDEASLRPLELFVQQSSSALENVRLYQETLGLQAYNEAVLQSIQQGIIVTDMEGEVETLNAFVRRHYGWGEELIGKNFFDAQPALRELGLAEDLAQVVKGSQPVERRNLQYTVGDELHTLNTYVYPRYDEEGEIMGGVILLEDVTQRARLEADIAQRGQQLAALSEVSRSITAALSVGDVITHALDQAGAVISYDQATLWLYSSEKDALTVSGVRGKKDGRLVEGQSVKLPDHPAFAALAEDRLPQAVDDVRADEKFSAIKDPHCLSWLGAPMISGGKLIGLLIFEKIESFCYAPADAQVAAAYANQVAVALENARLFEEAEERTTELQSRTQRLALLNRISSTLGRSLDQNSILQGTIDELAEAVGVPQAGVILFDEEVGTGRLAIQCPSNPDGSVDSLEIPLHDNALIDHLRREQAPLVVENVREDERVAPIRSALLKRKVKSALLVPLVVGNNVIGLITLDVTKGKRGFSAEQIELVQTITNQAAVSVQNAQLFQETVVRRAELGILFEAGRIASASLDLDTVVDSAARYFTRSLDTEGCSIYLLDKGRDALMALLHFHQEKGVRPVEPENHRYDLNRYLLTVSAIRGRDTVVIRSDQPELPKPEAEWLKRKEAAEALLLPLVARDETIGLVELWDSRKDRHFGQRDTRMGKALATSVATAMENARLHDETQKRLDELAIINEISRALTQTISTEDLYRVLQEQIGQVFHTQAMSIARRNPMTGQLTFPLAVRGGLRIHIEPMAFGGNLYSRVMVTQESLLISREVEETLQKWGVSHIEEGLQSFLAVPLVSGEKVIGTLSIEDYDQEDSFHEADLRVLAPIAAQVAVSMENTRLYGELEQRLSETTTLQEVSRVVNSALDLHEIFERVVRELAQAFQYPLITLYTLEGRDLHLQAQHGYDTGEIAQIDRLKISQGIEGRAAQSGQPQFVPDAVRDSAYTPVKDWVRSVIAVPILSDDRVRGVLAVQSGAAKMLADNDLQLLRTFAGQVSTAMANAELYTQMVELSEELERRVEERTRQLREERDRIDTLYRIAVELTASLDLDMVLNRALELVGEAVDAEHGSLFLIDPQSDKLIHRAVMSESTILPPGGRQVPLSRHEGMAGWVMDNRRSLIVGNVQVDARWSDVPGTEHNRSLLGAPLIANNEVLGCIFFTSDEEKAFHEGQVQLVEAAAQQVANSINNAELYRLIRDQAERLGSMLRSQQTEAAKSQAILESVADGVMVSDQTGEIILFNAAAERILEMRRDEALGRSTRDLAGLYGAGAERWAAMLREWSEVPTEYRGEFLADQIEIGSKVVSVHISPAMHNNEYLGLVSVFRDITREVMADRIKSEFVATVSHELRTPMTSIKGYADLLLLGAAGDITGDQRRFLDIIKNNADRLSLLVNDLLDISRIEQGGVDLDIRPLDIREVISDVILSVEGQKENDNRTIAIRAEMPEEMERIEGDYDRITQVISNLISNAYQYTPDEGSVTVRVTPDSEGLTVDIADTGIGIPEEDQARIFERFFRGENPLVMATAGTGLGLSIVQHLVLMHGGRVWFESEEGAGTTFSFWLPYKFPDDTPYTFRELRRLAQ